VDPRRVFLGKVRELRSRIDGSLASDDPEYEILMTAPLLRELLMGDPPLMDTVNKELRLKPKFHVARATALEKLMFEDAPIFYARGDGLYPGTALAASDITALNRDKFLQEKVMVVNGNTITVHDLIDYAANSAGALHFGSLDRKNREAVLEADLIKIGGFDATNRALKAVSLVVADGLQPLVEGMQANN
jgi:hypothetical protein